MSTSVQLIDLIVIGDHAMTVLGEWATGLGLSGAESPRPARDPRHRPQPAFLERGGLLKLRKAQQDAERERARQLWTDKGYVFTKPTGSRSTPHGLPRVEGTPRDRRTS